MVDFLLIATIKYFITVVSRGHRRAGRVGLNLSHEGVRKVTGILPGVVFLPQNEVFPIHRA